MNYSLHLSKLLSILSIQSESQSVANIMIEDLTADSRQVNSGSLFFAYPGAVDDGRDYIVNAAKAGAAAIFYESELDAGETFELSGEFDMPTIAVHGLRGKIGLMAHQFFAQPSTEMQVFGVTGTNGKTTCCYLLTQALNKLGNHANMIGTIGYGELSDLEYSGLTTPGAIELHRLLAKWRDQGVTQVCMEVSSHALDQGRVAGVHFFCALFTNLSHDHLDYHGDMQEYAAAKVRLFTDFHSELVITNADDVLGASLIDRANTEFVATYGDGGDVSVDQTELSDQGMRLQIEANGVDFDLQTSLIGKVNIPNILLLVATLLALSIDVKEIQRIVARLASAPGRMELFKNESSASVVVDFAHTPDALEKALASVKEHCSGDLWCVFGCGGDRDKTKRPIMGAAANKYADQIIVTNDNPRSEAPSDIADDIVAGITRDYQVILDRYNAIETAIKNSKSPDWILVAGRGHEPYQQIGESSIPFSDRAQVQQALEQTL